MVTVFDANPNALIDKTAEELKKVPVIKSPEWAVFVKTSPGNEKVPMREDWWYVRAAAILRAIYIKGPIGTEKLRTKFGSRRYRAKSRKPEHFVRASGSIIRHILQQLQTAGLVDLEAKAIKRGRRITGKGRQLMDNAARDVVPKPLVKKPVVKIEKAKVAKPVVKETKEAKPESASKPAEKPKILTELKPELKVEESKLNPITTPIAKPVEGSAIKSVVKEATKAEEKKE